MIVIDASVITKWFKPDEKSAEADIFLQEHSSGRELIFVPILSLYEVTSALRFSKLITRDEIEEAIEALFDVNLNYINPDEKFLVDTVRISLEANVSVYDASYVALARTLGCCLVTADQKLAEKIDAIVKVMRIESK